MYVKGKEENLSREAGQPGLPSRPGKGEVLLAPPTGLLCKVWLLDRLPEPDTMTLLGSITNSSCSDTHSVETSRLLSSRGDYLQEENARRPGQPDSSTSHFKFNEMLF